MALEWVTNEWAWVGAATAVAILAAWFILRIGRENTAVPILEVDSSKTKDKQKMTVENRYIYVPRQKAHSMDRVQCYDPATMEYLGFVPALKDADVQEHVRLAREAQKEWAKSPFSQRRLFLRILQRYIVDNQELICRMSARDSGKCQVDAEFGEIFTTLEKIAWLLKEGEKWLRTEYRSVGTMMLHKRARVEYHPLGVLGAIVPWNYPFHNIFNPMLAAVFSGNAIVIKASEHTSWSADFYARIIHGALRLAGAPPNLVHVVTGYAETGEALVTSGVDKLTFVGSTAVGRKVMAAASQTLTPVVLELGGKDAFIVCDDADLSQVVPTALRASFQCSGQNCITAERFFVHAGIYDQFVRQVVAIAKQMKMGPPLEGHYDMGSLCMPLQAERLHALVEDAVAKGAKVAVGGEVPKELGGQFYPPTVLLGVDGSMKVMQEEVFGPLMTIVKVAGDDEAVRLANDSVFGLGCAVFSRSLRRANRIAANVHCGMVSINDFGSTYLSQSLPFGGVKESGFDRFGGIEGLRGCCNVKAVQEDRFAWIKTRIPKPLQYPVAPEAFAFQEALMRMFYGISLRDRARGLIGLLKCLILPPGSQAKKAKNLPSKPNQKRQT